MGRAQEALDRASARAQEVPELVEALRRVVMAEPTSALMTYFRRFHDPNTAAEQTYGFVLGLAVSLNHPEWARCMLKQVEATVEVQAADDDAGMTFADSARHMTLLVPVGGSNG